MELTATIGALTFVLARSRTCLIGPLLGTPLLAFDGGEVQRMERRGRVTLLLDHRRDPRTVGPARIEWWRPVGASEGGVLALFVVADAAVG